MTNFDEPEVVDGSAISVNDIYENDDMYLAHYGIARRSGRYPWGSGEDPYQRSRQFKAYMDEMKSKGLSESEIAKQLTDYANRGITDPKQMITRHRDQLPRAGQLPWGDTESLAVTLEVQGRLNRFLESKGLSAEGVALSSSTRCEE